MDVITGVLVENGIEVGVTVDCTFVEGIMVEGSNVDKVGALVGLRFLVGCNEGALGNGVGIFDGRRRLVG